MNRRGLIWIPALALLAGCAALRASSALSPETLETVARTLLASGLLALFCAGIFSMKQAKSPAYSRFGKDSLCREIPKTGFGDVAANREAKSSLTGLVDYLKAPERYRALGARMPRGVLLYGPPGTGKTLLARALAGEANVPFFALSGSDFVQMYVGVGAGRVRELFANARKAGKCVIFIDEIDALGKRRSDAVSEERDQTLNALLSEMSGFRENDGVLVLAATNRLEALDPALLRPGRFDRQIEVGLPGRAERLDILRLHSRNKPLAQDVNLENLAADTCTFSGASLESLLNEAAILAAERSADEIGQSDLDRAFCRAVAGVDGTPAATADERCAIAVHEAGHALALHVLMPESRLKRVSILSGGRGAAGYNLAIPQEKTLVTRSDLERQVMVLLSGRAAELLTGGEEALTSGASGDLSRAAELVAAMHLDLGMGGEPAVAARALNAACGGGYAPQEECRRALGRLYEEASDLLAEHTDALLRLADALLREETISGERAEAILSEESVA